MNDRSYVTHQNAEIAQVVSAGRRQVYATKAAPVIAYDSTGQIVGVVDKADIKAFDSKLTLIYDSTGALLGQADPKAIQPADAGQPPAQPQQPAPPTPALVASAVQKSKRLRLARDPSGFGLTMTRSHRRI